MDDGQVPDPPRRAKSQHLELALQHAKAVAVHEHMVEAASDIDALIVKYCAVVTTFGEGSGGTPPPPPPHPSKP